MRISAIPAQITTVEDRIAGNLNLTQILLLALPIFSSAVIFFIFPPLGKLSIYKLVIIILFSSISASLAIRISGHLVIDILKLRAKYELRPRIYVFRKQQLNTTTRETTQMVRYTKSHRRSESKAVSLDTHLNGIGHKLLADQKYNVTFHQKSGGLIIKVSNAS